MEFSLLQFLFVNILNFFPSFQAELNILGDLVHPNLVKLIGFCIEDDQRLLVYEFMLRGSLENHLFRSTLQTYFISIVCVHYCLLSAVPCHCRKFGFFDTIVKSKFSTLEINFV